jgi:hypothetical protein
LTGSDGRSAETVLSEDPDPDEAENHPTGNPGLSFGQQFPEFTGYDADTGADKRDSANDKRRVSTAVWSTPNETPTGNASNLVATDKRITGT